MHCTLRLLVCEAALSIAYGQPGSYRGYTALDGTTVTPTFSFKKSGSLSCDSASTSKSPSNPNPVVGCTIYTSCGNWPSLNARTSVPVFCDGNGTLICEGMAYNECTMSVHDPSAAGTPIKRPPPAYPPNHSDGSFAARIGGADLSNRCNTHMSIQVPPQIYPGALLAYTFSVPLLGGGYANVHSGGQVDWGDGTFSPFPVVASAYGPFTILQSTVVTLTKQYDTVGPQKISAWMQGDFKDLFGSYRCRAQRWDEVYVRPPGGIRRGPKTTTELMESGKKKK